MTSPAPGRTPRISLALPVFNGEDYLDEAIATALAQTVSDLELVICDNASNDRSAAIAADWAARDERIRLCPAEEHAGAAPNFNRAFHATRGEFFKWVAHDDRLAPTYLERCLAAFDEDPQRVLVHSRMEEIDADGEVTQPLETGIRDLDDGRPWRRYSEAISLDHGCFDVFGLVRREVLASTRLIGSYLGSDRVLLAELALRGPFARVSEVLFQSREHAGRSIRMASDADREAWFDRVGSEGRQRPHWRRFHEMRAAIERAPLPALERFRCHSALVRWATAHGGALTRELLGRTSADKKSSKKSA